MFDPTKTSIKMVNQALEKAGIEASFDYRMKDLIILVMEGALRRGYNEGINEALVALGERHSELGNELRCMLLKEESTYGRRN